MTSRFDGQHGFTLIEALIAIVVISLGLLSLLALQTFAISATQSSQYRTVAAIGVADIGARIAANPAGAKQGAYDTIAAPGQPSTTCYEQICTPTQLAAFDAFQWNQGLANTLPNGRGFVDCTQRSTPGNGASTCTVYVVTIAWNARDLKQSASADSSLTCADTRHGITDASCIVAEVGP